MNCPAFHPARVLILAIAITTTAVLAAIGQNPTPPAGKAEQMSIPVAPTRINPTAPEELKGERKPSSNIPKGHIWSAVLIASNAAKPKDPPPELRAIAPRLKRVFGYNQFEICGEDQAPIEDGAERKLTPTRAFWIDLKARRASIKEARGGYLLNLRLYQNEKPIVDTVALIAPESPLFFRGPMHAKGQILIVLQVEPAG
jgi:hypothetical protein